MPVLMPKNDALEYAKTPPELEPFSEMSTSGVMKDSPIEIMITRGITI